MIALEELEQLGQPADVPDEEVLPSPRGVPPSRLYREPRLPTVILPALLEKAKRWVAPLAIVGTLVGLIWWFRR